MLSREWIAKCLESLKGLDWFRRPHHNSDSLPARADTSLSKAGLHLPSLNGIRALSFLLVFLGHAGLNQILPTQFGVTVFFFLSGYLITTLMRLELEKTQTVSLKHFYLRRVLRILPPFYLVFAFALGAWWIGLLPAPGEPQSIAAVLLHWSNYYIVAHDNQGFLTGTGVYWSLAVEEHFYLLFPIVYLCLNRIGLSARSQGGILLLLCLMFLAWRCVLVFVYHAPLLRTSVASDTRFDSLLFGCALAVYENPALDRSIFSERDWKYILLPIGLAALLAGFVIRDESFRETIRYTIQGLGLIPVFVCAVRYPDWLIIRPLNFRPLAFAGVLSYSLYLIHLVVLGLLSENVGSRLPAAVQSTIALTITLVLAWLMFKVVEKPCAELRRRLRV